MLLQKREERVMLKLKLSNSQHHLPVTVLDDLDRNLSSSSVWLISIFLKTKANWEKFNFD
jgi:hypothetical protein